MEIWKDIEGYEGLYQVSNFGQIRALNYRKQHISQVVKQGVDAHGYYKIRLSQNGRRTEYKVHRLVAIAFLENCGKLPEVNHKDGNKRNNNINNLEWVTKLDNIKHQFETGLVSKNANKKPVIAICIKDGVEKCFESIADASRNLGIKRCEITHCVSGKYKTSKGYMFNLIYKRGA